MPNDSNETIKAGRRRKGSGPSGRAEMPGGPPPAQRDTGSGGGQQPSSGSGQGTSGGFRIPGGMKGGLGCGGLVLVILIYLAIQLLSGGGGLTDTSIPSDQNGQTYEEIAEPTRAAAILPTKTPRKAIPTSSGAAADQTWTVMLYQDADDQILEQDIVMDFNEAERVGSSEQVNIVAQLDRYAGAYSGDGDWTTTRRYYLTRDRNLSKINSELMDDLGEISMADPVSLVDFVTWSVKNYPADKYVLILSDHGMGWPGGWTDPKPSLSRQLSVPIAQVLNSNMIYTTDIDRALQEIRDTTGIEQFELIGMDACLMAHLEVLSALAPHARYVVASQETEPALGWAYASFLQSLQDNPGMSGAELSDQIVRSYISGDQRIQDPEARAEFLLQGSPLQSLFGPPADIDPAQLSRQISKSATITAADISQTAALMDSLNQLAFALQSENQSVVAKARTYAQSFTSIFGNQVPPSYIDLGSFVSLIQEQSSNDTVQEAAAQLQAQLGQVVFAEKHGSQKPGATGISIYFPNSQLYNNAAAGPASYTVVADRFARDSLWDDFLAFHYTGEQFEMTTRNAVIPSRAVSAPGAGQISVSELKLSASTVNYDETVTMQANLRGSNIGYVYLFVGFYDQASGTILVADKDYLESPGTRQIGDLYYPVWSENQSFTLQFDWLPSLFAISDGETTAVALFQPEQYGATAGEAVYTVDGTYLSADQSVRQKARLYFADGKLLRVTGFSGDELGAPREIIPKSGDTFTITTNWLSDDGSGGYTQVTLDGQTVTFSERGFIWEEQYAAAGQYMVGFVVSDLDGNEAQSFGLVTVR